tara:strand:+ start:27 stop:941 length:915 start_codon:yes stop_codon:yes gene_type:complete
MHKNKKFFVCSFYKFICLTGLEQLKCNLSKFLKKNNFKGTILLGNEGINGSVSCEKHKLKSFKSFLEQTLSTKIDFKVQNHDFHAFLRLKIKIKQEIIRMKKKNSSPLTTSGKLIQPSDWDKLLEAQDVLTIDTRNNYESEIGTFKNSIKTNTLNFTEFPNWVKKHKSLFNDKKIAMFCTGGIRCEKASSYLLKLGFEEVYQLEGGIINYLKKTKNKKKLWLGECFVFDERVSINEDLQKGNFFQCYACRSAITKNQMKSKNYSEGISCPKCYDKTSATQKRSFAERQKQLKLANKKGIKHLGS